MQIIIQTLNKNEFFKLSDYRFLHNNKHRVVYALKSVYTIQEECGALFNWIPATLH